MPTRGSVQQGEVTDFLRSWTEGEPEALDALIPLVFEELRVLARQRLARERPDHTLGPTAVVHEVYLRLHHQPFPPVQDRQHFFALVSRLMRQLLVEYGRARRADKRGQGLRLEAFDEERMLGAATGLDLEVAMSVHRAVEELETRDPALARLVTLRYLVGLTVPEVAEVLELSRATVERRWSLARRRLAEALESVRVDRRNL